MKVWIVGTETEESAEGMGWVVESICGSEEAAEAIALEIGAQAFVAPMYMNKPPPTKRHDWPGHRWPYTERAEARNKGGGG